MANDASDKGFEGRNTAGKSRATLAGWRGLGDTAVHFVVILGIAGVGGPAALADDESPDLEFLEYLGSWEESDEDWLLFDEETAADNDDTGPDDADGNAVAEQDMTELEQ